MSDTSDTQQDQWIVFDLIGVLAEPSWRELKRASDLTAWNSLKSGAMDESDFWDDEHADLYRALLAFRPDRLRFLARLKERGFKICIATNFHADWIAPLEQSLQDPDLISAWVISSRERVAKPSVEFWQRVLEFVPVGTVFIDDREDNCEAADRAGLRSVWAHPAMPMEDEVERLLAEHVH